MLEGIPPSNARHQHIDHRWNTRLLWLLVVAVAALQFVEQQIPPKKYQSFRRFRCTMVDLLSRQVSLKHHLVLVEDIHRGELLLSYTAPDVYAYSCISMPSEIWMRA